MVPRNFHSFNSFVEVKKKKKERKKREKQDEKGGREKEEGGADARRCIIRRRFIGVKSRFLWWKHFRVWRTLFSSLSFLDGKTGQRNNPPFLCATSDSLMRHSFRYLHDKESWNYSPKVGSFPIFFSCFFER